MRTVDKSFRQSVLDAVTAATGQNKGRLRGWLESRFPMELRHSLYRNGFTTEWTWPVVMFLFSMALVFLGAIGFSIASGVAEFHSTRFDIWNDVPAILSGQAALVMGLAFLIYAPGKPIFRKHVSTLYPIRDDSFRHYARRRICISLCACFAVSSFCLFNIAIKFPILEWSFWLVLLLILTQTLFSVAVANVLAQINRSHEVSVICALGCVVMFIAFGCSAGFCSQEVGFLQILHQHHGAYCLLSPHSWPVAFLFMLIVTNSMLVWSLVIPIVGVIVSGIKSHRELATYIPENEYEDFCFSMRSSDQLEMERMAEEEKSNDSVVAGETTRYEPLSNERSVLLSIESFANPKGRTLWQRYIFNWLPDWSKERARPTSKYGMQNDLPGWAKRLLVAVLIIVFSLIGSVWLVYCFDSPHSYASQSSAALFCHLILAIAWLGTWSIHSRIVASHLYPIGPKEFSGGVLRSAVGSLLVCLPVYLFWCVVFCSYFEFDIYEQIFFVVEPVLIISGLILFSISLQFTTASGNRALRWIWLSLFSMMFVFLFICLMVLLNPDVYSSSSAPSLRFRVVVTAITVFGCLGFTGIYFLFYRFGPSDVMQSTLGDLSRPSR